MTSNSYSLLEFVRSSFCVLVFCVLF